MGDALSVLGLALAASAYTVRATPAREIQDVLLQWSNTWDSGYDAVARNSLSCAKQQIPNPSTPPDPKLKLLTTHLTVEHVYLGADLTTAYITAELSEWPTAGGSQSLHATTSDTPFELVKEEGRWKVCDWGSYTEESHGVISGGRVLLLGWKLWGSPN
ncbi:hypothetical protein [Nocardia asiatica]|uniref:hypothetical protein n=1 Tax=Nocardia asiatica TaxID=209252 RepID=UPI002453F6E2|nr:hypothetical protein [Nocardia asiatica]